MRIHNGIAVRRLVPGDVIVPCDVFSMPHLVTEIGFVDDDEQTVFIVTDEDRYELDAHVLVDAYRRTPKSEARQQYELELRIDEIQRRELELEHRDIDAELEGRSPVR